MKKKKLNIEILKYLAFCFFCASGYMLYKGYDKMTHYFSSDTYFSQNVNAYVGGDAYNYIINGNYATGFFVLSMGFLISGLLLICTYLIVNAIPEKTTPVAIKQEYGSAISDELPDL